MQRIGVGGIETAKRLFRQEPDPAAGVDVHADGPAGWRAVPAVDDIDEIDVRRNDEEPGLRGDEGDPRGVGREITNDTDALS